MTADEREASLDEAKRMEAVGRLASGVAHDFNNLLSIVLNYASFVARELPESSPLQADLAEIRRAGERGAALTRQLLTFGSREAGDPQVIDVNSMLGELGQLLDRTIGDHIELRLERAEDLRPAEADLARAEQAIVELAIKARDEMPEGGVLAIATANVELDHSDLESHPEASPGPHVRVTVADTRRPAKAFMLDLPAARRQPDGRG